MLKLITLPPAFGMRNVSPFCLKIEMLLTALDIPFQLEEQPDPRKAPKGKMPYLIIEGKPLADSELIAQRLDAITQGKVYGTMSPEQQAHGLGLARLAEDHLYWLMVASRWLDDAWFPNVVEGFFGYLPAPARLLGSRLAQRQMRKTYDLHGLGRHTLEEQQGFAVRDLQGLQDGLPPTDFLAGARPGVHDFAVAAMMTGILYNKPATWLTHLAQPFTALQDYTERVQKAVGVSALH